MTAIPPDVIGSGGEFPPGFFRETDAEPDDSAFVVELTLLRGRERLGGVPVESLLPY